MAGHFRFIRLGGGDLERKNGNKKIAGSFRAFFALFAVNLFAFESAYIGCPKKRINSGMLITLRRKTPGNSGIVGL